MKIKSKFLFLLLFTFSTAFANFPEKPITIVVHSKPGSGIDIASRLISNIAKKYTDAIILVENKTGGSGTVAMKTVLSKHADGYTILAVTKSFISTMLLSNTGISINNFDWIAMMVSDPEALIVNNTSEIKTFEDIINDAKTKNGKQKWLGPLVGGLDHLFAIQVWDKLNIKARWIPYEGGSDAIVALMGKQGAVYVGNPADISGRPTLSLAIVAAKKRLKNFPNVPTFKEKGYPIEEVLWRGFAIKKGTPPKIKKFLENLFKKIANDPDWISFVNNNSAIPIFYGEKEFTKIVKKDQEKARYYLTKAGILKTQSDKKNKDNIPPYVPVIVFILIYGILKKIKPKQTDGETAIALAMIILSVYVYFLSLGFEVGKLSGTIGPATIPELWSFFLFLFSTTLLAKKFKSKTSVIIKNRNSKRALGLILLIIFYFLGMNYIGFYISTALFLPAGILWLNYKNLIVISLSTIGFLLLSYYIIQIVLQVPLPSGILFN